ncbi:MAG: hypothetical protein NVS4B6_12720 [Mycobacterium sp.]
MPECNVPGMSDKQASALINLLPRCLPAETAGPVLLQADHVRRSSTMYPDTATDDFAIGGQSAPAASGPHRRTR